MTFCNTCGEAFGDITESRAHQAACQGKPCDRCDGSGTEPNTERTACYKCDGRGTVKK